MYNYVEVNDGCLEFLPAFTECKDRSQQRQPQRSGTACSTNSDQLSRYYVFLESSFPPSISGKLQLFWWRQEGIVCVWQLLPGWSSRPAPGPNRRAGDAVGFYRAASLGGGGRGGTEVGEGVSWAR